MSLGNLSRRRAVTLRALTRGRTMSFGSHARRRAVALRSLTGELMRLERSGKLALGLFLVNTDAHFPAVSSARAACFANRVASCSTLEEAVAVKGVWPVVAGLAGREVLGRAGGRARWRARRRVCRSTGDEERGDDRHGLEMHLVCHLSEKVVCVIWVECHVLICSSAKINRDR